MLKETKSVFVDSGDAKKFLKLKFNLLWKKQELFFKSISNHDILHVVFLWKMDIDLDDVTWSFLFPCHIMLLKHSGACN